MKTKWIVATLVVYTVAFVFSCSDKKQAETQDHVAMEHASTDQIPTEAAAPAFSVDPAFQLQLAEAFTAYVSLKEAFVATDVAKVKTAATRTMEAVSKIDMKLLTGAAHNDWMTYLSGLESALKSIQASEDIEEQRTSFSQLSDHLYKSIKAFGLGGVSAYYEFCPMAFNNQGAYWLSDNEAIRNPYFGDKMLKCGSVEEKLQ